MKEQKRKNKEDGREEARKMLPMEAGISQAHAEKRISKIIFQQAANKLA